MAQVIGLAAVGLASSALQTAEESIDPLGDLAARGAGSVVGHGLMHYVRKVTLAERAG